MKWTADLVVQLGQRIAAGETTSQLRARFGASKSGMMKQIVKNGFPLPVDPRVWPKDRDDLLISLWNGGAHMDAMSEALNRNPKAVYGRARFLKLSRKAVRPVVVKAPAKPKGTPSSGPVKPRAIDPVVWAMTPNARPWMDRKTFGECAWPLGERGQIHSCCAPTPETYCTEHRAMMGGEKRPYLPRGGTVNRGPSTVFDRGLAA